MKDRGELIEGLDRRGLIWQCQGLLMARLGLSADEAFDLLMRAAERRQITLSAVAREFVSASTSSEAVHHDDLPETTAVPAGAHPDAPLSGQATTPRL
jgi:hypothetical protein